MRHHARQRSRVCKLPTDDPFVHDGRTYHAPAALRPSDTCSLNSRAYVRPPLSSLQVPSKVIAAQRSPYCLAVRPERACCQYIVHRRVRFHSARSIAVHGLAYPHRVPRRVCRKPTRATSGTPPRAALSEPVGGRCARSESLYKLPVRQLAWFCRPLARGASHREPSIRNFQSLSIYWRTQMVRACRRARRVSASTMPDSTSAADCTCAMRTQLELEAADGSNLTSKQMLLACGI